MSMTFDGFAIDGTIQGTNLPYCSTMQFYNKFGFNNGIDRNTAFSGNKTAIAGATFATFDSMSVTKVVNPTNTFQVNVRPYTNTAGAVYNFPVYDDTAIRQTMQVNGYNTSRRTMTAPTNINNNSLYNNYGRFYMSFTPNRTALIIARNQNLTWAETSMTVSEWGKYIKKELWDLRDCRQWVLMSTINNVINNSYFRYDTRETPNAYTGVATDFLQDTKNSFYRYIDDSTNLTAFVKGVHGGTASPAGQISYNKNSGAVVWTPNTNADDLAKAGVQTWAGKYPAFSFTRDDFFNHWGIESQYITDHYLLYVAGKLWHYDTTTFRLIDIDGNEMPETLNPDYTGGAYWVRISSDTATQSTFFIYPAQHISQMFIALSSYGVPISSPLAAIYAPIISDVGDGSGAFYQNRINANGFTGDSYVDLYKNPTLYQGFRTNEEIPFVPIDSVPIEETPLEIPQNFYIGAGTEVYSISQAGLNTTINNLFNVPSSVIEMIEKYNGTLAESIKSVMVFPFAIPRVVNTVAGNIVFHGEELLNTAGRVRQATGTYYLGNYTIPDRGNFLDYSPYSEYFLYLPYCGMIKLSPRDIVGKTISISYVIDIITGSCTANIFRDGVLIKTETGQIGFSIPITSRDYTTQINGFIQAAASTAGTIANAALATNPVTAISTAAFGAFGVANGLDRLSESTLEQKGTTSNAGAFVLPQYPFIIKVSAKIADYDGYRREKGVACLETKPFNSFQGFTVFQDVRLDDVPLTATEKNELKTILENGVYIY